MANPFQTNTTCDVYRSGNAPPAAPDVSAVAIRLQPDFATAHRANFNIFAGASTSTAPLRWTHTALVPLATDLRDDYTGAIGAIVIPTTFDTIYVPDKNGTPFQVLFVERIGYGTPNDYKRVYLQRGDAPWPTNNL